MMEACLKSFIISLAVCLICFGCQPIKEFIEPEARFYINASHTINPDSNGRPSPLVVNVYELKSKSLFEALDFFSLYDSADKFLGPDLLVKKEIYLQPGEKLVYQADVNSNVEYVGFVAAYRDINNSNWRAITSIDTNDQNEYLVELDGLDITLHQELD